ncbi:hypothetical protein JXQ31_13110 [candidate division KSB1 bacterium]|nr:hypothetical protein [candidate division KSB1 bacterium]
MSYPDLLILPSIDDYRKYYEDNYCRAPILTFDNIPVYFSKYRFKHAFFESSKRNNIKDLFSIIRAERIDWIKATLTNPDAKLYQGWNKKKHLYDPYWRVNVVYGDFVVIIKMGYKKNGKLKAEFRTAYNADNSIIKIQSSPKWDRSLLKQKNR